MEKEVWIALAGLAGTAFTAWIAYRKDVRLKELEMKQEQAPAPAPAPPPPVPAPPVVEVAAPGAAHEVAMVWDVVCQFSVFDRLLRRVHEIFEQTPVDRFLILYGVNGQENVGSVSVFFQMFRYEKHEIDAINRYADISIDEEYQNMLKRIEQHGTELHDVERMPPSLLRDFYQADGVTYSVVKFIARKQMSPGRDVIIFCSFSTHGKEPIVQNHLALIRAKFGSLRKAIADLLKKKGE